MLLVATLFVINTLSVFATVNHVEERSGYCLASASAADAIQRFNVATRDIGFEVDVHALEGKVFTSKFSSTRVFKEVESDLLTMSFWSIESNQGVQGLKADGFATLLAASRKLENCNFDGLSAKEKLLVSSYFPQYDASILEIHISENSDFIAVVSDRSHSSVAIVYETLNKALVIRGDISLKNH